MPESRELDYTILLMQRYIVWKDGLKLCNNPTGKFLESVAWVLPIYLNSRRVCPSAAVKSFLYSLSVVRFIDDAICHIDHLHSCFLVHDQLDDGIRDGMVKPCVSAVVISSVLAGATAP